MKTMMIAVNAIVHQIRSAIIVLETTSVVEADEIAKKTNSVKRLWNLANPAETAKMELTAEMAKMANAAEMAKTERTENTARMGATAKMDVKEKTDVTVKMGVMDAMAKMGAMG
jgi:hypothetical protein